MYMVQVNANLKKNRYNTGTGSVASGPYHKVAIKWRKKSMHSILVSCIPLKASSQFCFIFVVVVVVVGVFFCVFFF